MPRLPWLAAALLTLALAPAAPAQTALRWKLQDPFWVEVELNVDSVGKYSGNDLEQSQSVKMVLACKPLDADDDGTTVRVTVDSVTAQRSVGGRDMADPL